MKNLTRLLSAEELAKILNISEFTIKRLAREKQIPCHVIKRRYQFNVKELLRFFRKMEGGGA
jgi:excisionase family DNA binding protein